MLDDFLEDAVVDLAIGDRVAVLRGNHHAIHARWPAVDIFHGHLRFAVWPQERHMSRLTHFRKPPHQLMRQHNRQRHQFVGFVAGIAEHQALVARAAGIHAHGDVGRLALDGGDHGAGVGVKAVFRAGVADVANHPADDFAVIQDRGGGDLSGHHGQAGGHQRLAGHSAPWRPETARRPGRRRRSGRRSYRDGLR